MVCIFILLYYPVYYFITVRDRGAKACLFTTLRAVAASLIGIGMSAVMLLPTYISMQNAYYFSSEMPEEWSFYYNVLDVLNQLLPTAHLTHLDGLPNLCCGYLVTVMLACYFMSREIPYREKLLHGAFLVFMFFSLNINKLDFVWHGMHFPNQLPHRFSFVICFLLVAMGYRAFNRLNGISAGRLTLAEVCNKKDVEALYQHHNESSWQLYGKNDTRLTSLLWNKLRPSTAGKKRIYLTPCGLLNRVNFLMFDTHIYELSSVCELIRPYNANPRSDALLIGDIDYDQSTTSAVRGERDWGALNGTRLEIESIAKTLSARYAVTKLTKDFGTEQTVRKLCNASPKILHFATHAICYTDQLRRDQYGYFDFPHNYDPERPELTYTGLVLSGGNIGFKRTGNRRLDNDGILLSEEIAKLHLENTDLAVLSACNSANGIFDDIDGTLGLVKAFKLAGVNTIIASLSKVDDQATSQFMSHFYLRLSRGESLHAAFINAINHMKTRYPDQPKFWAMFKMIDCREP